MKYFLPLFLHELKLLFISASTYIASLVFLLFMGFLYFIALIDSNTLPTYDFFTLFWLQTMFVIPLLTMKSIAEDKRMGTLDALLTTPVGSFEVVFSKFLASFTFYMLLWAITILFPIFAIMSVPDFKSDLELLKASFAPILGGYLFIFISGLQYTSIGIFASSLTRSTLVAGMLSFSMLFFVVVGGGLVPKISEMGLPWLSWLENPSKYLNTFKHLEDFSRGIIDTRVFFFYLTTSIFMLAITSITLESKK